MADGTRRAVGGEVYHVSVTGGSFTGFDSTGGGNYAGEQGDNDMLVDNASTHLFTLTDTSGNRTTFYDFSSTVSAQLQGTFKSSSMAGSGGAAVQATNSAGFPYCKRIRPGEFVTVK
jgi:hypothetical protein